MKKFILAVCILTTVKGSTLFAQTLADAVKQTTNEQFETADATFKSLIQKEPGKGEYYFYYGENFFKNDNEEMAEKMYNKGIEVNATDPLCYIGLGKIQWYNKKETEAKSNFYKAVTLSQSKNITVFMKIAEVYINAENKDIPEAINLLNKALKLNDKNPEVHILLGDAYLEQNNGTEAIKYYNQAIELDKNAVTAIVRKGKLYSRARNYTDALLHYKEASEKDPSFAPAYREKAEIYYRAGQYQNAVEQYQKFLELNNNLSARIRYTGFLFQAKKYEDAIKEGTEIFKTDSSNAYLYRYLGYTYYEQKDYPRGLNKMESFFKKAGAGKEVKIIPQDYEYYGQLLLKNGMDSLGILTMKKALEMDSSRLELYGDIGAEYIKKKMYPEAIEMYKKKIAKSEKESANDNFALGRAYYFSKEFLKADTAFAKITVSNPDLSLGYLWRARANAQYDPKNELWLAKEHYETYIAKVKPEEIEKNKKDIIEAYTYMGAYLIGQKDMAAASEFFKKIRDLDSANQMAKNFFESSEGQKYK